MLCDLIRFNVKSMTIRTRASYDPCLLCVHPISKTCADSFFDRSFMYTAPTLCNNNIIIIIIYNICIAPYNTIL